MNHDQRTTDWLMARLGKITASRFKDILTPPRAKVDRENGTLSDTAYSYMIELITERIYGQPLDKPITQAMRWGNDWEDSAREQAIAFIADQYDSIEHCGFIQHPDHPGIGASPDGLIGKEGGFEAKCPFNPVNHVRTLIDGDMPYEHKPQVQGAMWVTGRKWWLFCSFDPRLDALPMFATLVARDDRYINEELAPAVIRFKTLLDEQHARLVDYMTNTFF